jgi:hypothetical protein
MRKILARSTTPYKLSNSKNPNIIMDIVKDNFEKLFESTIRPAIVNADFVAVDCEFSGLGELKRTFFDSLQQRYIQAASSASKFQLIQLGVCAVRKLDNDTFETIPFTFSMFPSNVIRCWWQWLFSIHEFMR